MMKIRPEPLTAAAFAPFGDVLEAVGTPDRMINAGLCGRFHDRALIDIADAGQVSIDKISGPVGEALIMTAIGLVVAIPAVLGYNAFTRVNRITLSELDGFAHDLHAHLTTGARIGSDRRQS